MDNPANDRSTTTDPPTGDGVTDEQARRLDAMSWAYRSRRLHSLGFDFGVRVSDEVIGRYVGELFEPFAVPGEPTSFYSIIDQPDLEARYSVYFEGEHVVTALTASAALRRLQWDVNARVIAPNREYVLIHASVAADDGGRAVVMPAAMDSGKTTLVAGLVRAGLRYMSDEAAAIHPETGVLHAYPKALTIDEGSWKVLEDLRPELGPELAPFGEEQWYVPSDAIRPGSIATTGRPALVVAPRYVANGRTELVPVSRAEALQMLLENAFNFRLFPSQAALSALARLVSGADCYRLSVAGLSEACSIILDLLERSSGPHLDPDGGSR